METYKDGKYIKVDDIPVIELTTDQRKQIILYELSELDKEISRVEEDIINAIKLPLHTSKQAILDRKNALRLELKTL